MKKLILGKGLNDADYQVTWQKEGKQASCPCYAKWRYMLQRCLSEKYKINQPTYRGCKVDDSWLVFSNFKKWFDLNYTDGWELDKDILGDGTIYSKETCCFIPKYLNLFLVDRKNHRGDNPVGVHYDKVKLNFQAHCSNPIIGKYESLGRHKTEKDAHLAWINAKISFIPYVTREVDDKIRSAVCNKYNNILINALKGEYYFGG